MHLTPINHITDNRIGPVWLKRDDLYTFAGISGGKVRTCRALAETAKQGGYKGLVTAGARSSPQAVIVAYMARYFGLACRVHMPTGHLSDQGKIAEAAGAKIIQHKPGHNSVIIARARQDAKDNNYFEIPFGMQCEEAVNQTKQQVSNLPLDTCERIIVPVGSGMTLAGVLHGLQLYDKHKDRQVIGVQVGADPIKRLDKYAPLMWRYRCRIIKSGWAYNHHIAGQLGGVKLDPVYEAKMVPFVEPNDCVWLVGIRRDT